MKALLFVSALLVGMTKGMYCALRRQIPPMPQTVAIHWSNVVKPQFLAPPSLLLYWAHHG